MTQWKRLVTAVLTTILLVSTNANAKFYSVDPVSAEQHIKKGNIHGFNRYAYANNNPYKYTDPDGRIPILVPLVFIGKEIAGEVFEQTTGIPAPTLKNAGKAIGKQVLKQSTLKPGKFAKNSIPARGPQRNFTKEERAKINEMGKTDGCHTCGAKEAGTKSGNFVPDHQPPNALAQKGEAQKLFPHCKSCSQKQAGQVTQEKRRRENE